MAAGLRGCNMRRRPDVIDTFLEDWASWRVLYKQLDFGTGNSPIARFLEPRGTRGTGSMPLWHGMRTGQKLLALDNDLTVALGPAPVAMLVALYGMPGPIDRKAKAMSVTVNDLQTLRRRARCVALEHIPQDTTAGGFDRARYRLRSKQPGSAVQPLSPVPETDQHGS